LKTKIEELEKVIKFKNLKPAKDEMEVLLKVDALLQNLKNVRDGEWTAKEIEFLN
jgi:hypothetical protein